MTEHQPEDSGEVLYRVRDHVAVITSTGPRR